MSNFLEWSIYKEWKKNWLEHNNEKQSKMKKHNFKEAIEIFKAMFEGWVAVTKFGAKHQLTGCDINENKEQQTLYFNHEMWMESEISHLEQTKPMNGDEVWAWSGEGEEKHKYIYVGKDKVGNHVCQTGDFGLWLFNHVELISPTRKITIQEATEMLKEIVTEPFEIIKE